MAEQQEEPKASAQPRLPGRGREVNRRIAGGDLQRIQAQVRLVRRVYAVGAVSTAILTGLLMSSIGTPGMRAVPLFASLGLLTCLVSVQLLAAMDLPWAPRAWSLAMACLQSITYLVWLLVSESTSTQLIWVVLFWLSVPPMARAERYRSKHADLYRTQLLQGKAQAGEDLESVRPATRYLRVLGFSFGLAIAGGLLAYGLKAVN